LKEGKEEGLKKGKEEGLKEGEEKGLKKGQILGIVKLAEDGDISKEKAMEKLQAFRDELPDNEFWQSIDTQLKSRN
jgi:flagellar biosynthesis/type III secretory pathway protein FliH